MYLNCNTLLFSAAVTFAAPHGTLLSRAEESSCDLNNSIGFFRRCPIFLPTTNALQTLRLNDTEPKPCFFNGVCFAGVSGNGWSAVAAVAMDFHFFSFGDGF